MNICSPALGADFDVDEIITVIKQEIQAVRAMGGGKPDFEIDSVAVHLSVISGETDQRGLSLRIAGFSSEDIDYQMYAKPYHKLKFTFSPNSSRTIPHDSSFGLVEPIKNIKSSLVKAYNSPPLFHIEDFNFELEFALEKTPDGRIRFQVMNLSDLKSLNVATHKLYIHMSSRD
jgi:hypothetical protein